MSNVIEIDQVIQKKSYLLSSSLFSLYLGQSIDLQSLAQNDIVLLTHLESVYQYMAESKRGERKPLYKSVQPTKPLAIQ